MKSYSPIKKIAPVLAGALMYMTQPAQGQNFLQLGYDTERGVSGNTRIEKQITDHNSIGINAYGTQADNVEGVDAFFAGDFFVRRELGKGALEGRIGGAGTEDFQFMYGGGSANLNLSTTRAGNLGLRISGVYSGNQEKTVDATTFMSQDRGEALITLLNNRFLLEGGYAVEKNPDELRHGATAQIAIPIKNGIYAIGNIDYMIGNENEFRAGVGIRLGNSHTTNQGAFPYVVTRISDVQNGYSTERDLDTGRRDDNGQPPNGQPPNGQTNGERTDREGGDHTTPNGTTANGERTDREGGDQITAR